jgi:hypothetical protein
MHQSIKNLMVEDVALYNWSTEPSRVSLPIVIFISLEFFFSVVSLGHQGRTGWLGN